MNNIIIIINSNPFYLGWNKCWIFLLFLEGANAKIEARGYGISITTSIEKEKSPYQSEDRLVLKEQINRKLRYYSWIKLINQKVDVIN